MTEKHVYLVDRDLLLSMQSDLATVKNSLQNLKMITPKQSEHLTADQFMTRTKISRWKFDLLVKTGVLRYKKIGRKFYVPEEEVPRYFAGEMVIK